MKTCRLYSVIYHFCLISSEESNIRGENKSGDACINDLTTVALFVVDCLIAYQYRHIRSGTALTSVSIIYFYKSTKPSNIRISQSYSSNSNIKAQNLIPFDYTYI